MNVLNKISSNSSSSSSSNKIEELCAPCVHSVRIAPISLVELRGIYDKNVRLISCKTEPKHTQRTYSYKFNSICSNTHSLTQSDNIITNPHTHTERRAEQRAQEEMCSRALAMQSEKNENEMSAGGKKGVRVR